MSENQPIDLSKEPSINPDDTPVSGTEPANPYIKKAIDLPSGRRLVWTTQMTETVLADYKAAKRHGNVSRSVEDSKS